MKKNVKTFGYKVVNKFPEYSSEKDKDMAEQITVKNIVEDYIRLSKDEPKGE